MSFAAGPLAGARPIPDGGSIAVQPEHAYGVHLVIDGGAKRAGVTREAGRPIDGGRQRAPRSSAPPANDPVWNDWERT